jgi:hypothetical protein
VEGEDGVGLTALLARGNQCNEVPPNFERALVSYFDKVELTDVGVGIGEGRGEGVITPPSALALDGGAVDRAKHWLHPRYRRKGCGGKGVMMKGIKQ